MRTASSLEWHSKYSITKCKQTAYFPCDRVSLGKVLPQRLFVDCMGKLFVPIQQVGESQTNKVAVSLSKPDYSKKTKKN
jgi:hypothetical protein